MRELPDELKQTVLRIFGEQGESWAEQFPGILARCRERWGLKLGAPLAGLSINYLAHATLPSGESVVLKVGVPHPELQTEIESLRIWGGRRIVRCVDADLQLGAMLLEELAPGDMLTVLKDNHRETTIAAGIMRELHIPAPAEHHLPTFMEWIERAFARYRKTFDPQDGPLGELVDLAEQAFNSIEETKERDVLLHGDLHHENILFDDRHGWTAIDPKGVIGDPCLEVGRYLHNQLPNEMPLAEKHRLIKERVEVMHTELGESTARLTLCGLIDKVLSLTWSLEDSYVTEDWAYGREVAQLLQELAKDAL